MEPMTGWPGMTHNIAPIGKAMTAIAAVVAFSSTPLLAQDAGADPLAPEVAAEKAPAAAELAPPPPELISKPKVETGAAASSISKPKVETAKALTKPSATSTAKSTVRRTAARPVTAAAPVAAAVAAPAPETSAPPPPPVDAVPPPPTASQSVAAPAQPANEPAQASSGPAEMLSALMADDTLPYAGGAALGLLVLGGAGLARRRRRRRREDEEFEARQMWLASNEAQPVLELDQEAEVRPEPAFAAAAPAIHDPVPEKKIPTAELPDGLDLSKFGPHVQAAYRGPTHDNPSVSLEYRLRKAAILDEQERKARLEGAKQAPPPPADVPTEANRKSRPEVEFMLGRGGTNRVRPSVADTSAK